ncbi:MAG: hypothetical protein R3249_05195 [Nitriliruptorales bacterium]|nr:hypothetical protein [Nitriliruptorales bacterium]
MVNAVVGLVAGADVRAIVNALAGQPTVALPGAPGEIGAVAGEVTTAASPGHVGSVARPASHWEAAPELDALRARAAAALAGSRPDALIVDEMTIPFWRTLLPAAGFVTVVPPLEQAVVRRTAEEGIPADRGRSAWLAAVACIDDDTLVIDLSVAGWQSRLSAAVSSSGPGDPVPALDADEAVALWRHAATELGAADLAIDHLLTQVAKAEEGAADARDRVDARVRRDRQLLRDERDAARAALTTLEAAAAEAESARQLARDDLARLRSRRSVRAAVRIARLFGR